MLLKLLSVLAFSASSVLAAATPTVNLQGLFNPPASGLQARYRAISQLDARGLTNAKRLAAGLPPLPPRRRNPAEPAQPRPSGQPCKDGFLEVRDKHGDTLGHVRNTFNKFGQYGLTDKDDDRLLVCIDLDSAKHGHTDIRTKNGPDHDLSFFGAISGYTSDCECSNLNHNSRNYAYIGATTQTSPWSPPLSGANSFSKTTKISRKIESAIYTVDPSFRVTAQWINEDHHMTDTELALSQGALVLTGDESVFSKHFGSTPVDLFFHSM